MKKSAKKNTYSKLSNKSINWHIRNMEQLAECTGDESPETKARIQSSLATARGELKRRQRS